MEAIVNYSSEDEHDEANGSSVADCGRRTNRSRSAIGSGRSGLNHSPYTHTNDASATGTVGRGGTGNVGRSSHYPREEEASQKHRSSSAANRSAHYGRDNNRTDKEDRHYRDDRDSRNVREPRDYKMHERTRSKDYKDEYKRDTDSHRGGKRTAPRDDDRNYTRNRHSFSTTSTSSHYKDRFSSNSRGERSRHSDSSARNHHQHQYNQRSRDERDERDEHPNRYERSEKPRPRHNPRSRSRSPPSNSKERERHVQQELQHHRAPQPLEQARQSALEMERKLNVAIEQHDTDSKPISVVPETPARRIPALLSLPLNDVPKQPSLIAVAPPCASAYASATSFSNNMEPAIIQLPSYYNPSVINPNKYAEQVQKRKLLWGAKKNEDTTAKWGNAQFSQDTDGKVASKFMRLMGIKGGAGAKGEHGADDIKEPVAAPDVRSREAMFSSMEQQYEVARQATHTMRGVGLGFGSQARPF